MLRNIIDRQCVWNEVCIVLCDMLSLEIGAKIVTYDLECFVLITQMFLKLSAVFGSLLFLDGQKNNGEKDEVELNFFVL